MKLGDLYKTLREELSEADARYVLAKRRAAAFGPFDIAHGSEFDE